MEFPSELEMKRHNFTTPWSLTFRVESHRTLRLCPDLTNKCCMFSKDSLTAAQVIFHVSTVMREWLKAVLCWGGGALLNALLGLLERPREGEKSPPGRWSIFNEFKPLPQMKWNILKGKNITCVLFVSATWLQLHADTINGGNRVFYKPRTLR